MPRTDEEYWWSVAFVVVVELDAFAPSSSITCLKCIHFQ